MIIVWGSTFLLWCNRLILKFNFIALEFSKKKLRIDWDMELQKILYGLANTELFRQSHYKNYFALLSHYSTTDHFGSWKSP